MIAWIDGFPPKPWSGEWFIAETTYGDRVVLRALPDEYSHDFTTADHTYLMADLVARWMQFPDSEYKTFAALVRNDALEEAARICDVTPPEPFRPSIEAAHAIRKVKTS